MFHSTMRINEVAASALRSTSGASAKSIDVSTAKAVEAWVNVTAVGPGNFDFRLETSLDGGVTWYAAATIAGSSSTGAKAMAIRRGTAALGILARIAWTANSGDQTFSAQIAIQE
jgi:hypothetical protein